MIQIAIDGPAGAGKSTIAKAIAEDLNINYMDTGAMYRAVAYVMIRRGIDTSNPDKVRKAQEDIRIQVKYIGGTQYVFAEGTDVSPYIRTPEVSMGASNVAVVPEVRMKLVETQRATAEKYDIVMDGRDIGTYVLPNAPVKFYLTASPAERAKRRYLDLKEAGIEKDIKELEEEIIARDKNDSGRSFAPLKCADDAILLDTTDMSIEEVITTVKKRIKEVYGNLVQNS